jgi:hypothetical protein
VYYKILQNFPNYVLLLKAAVFVLVKIRGRLSLVGSSEGYVKQDSDLQSSFILLCAFFFILNFVLCSVLSETEDYSVFLWTNEVKATFKKWQLLQTVCHLQPLLQRVKIFSTRQQHGPQLPSCVYTSKQTLFTVRSLLESNTTWSRRHCGWGKSNTTQSRRDWSWGRMMSRYLRKLAHVSTLQR